MGDAKRVVLSFNSTVKFKKSPRNKLKKVLKFEKKEEEDVFSLCILEVHFFTGLYNLEWH